MLGCGTSVGVPALGHAGWGGCDPKDPRNRRQRCAVLVEINDKAILVDAGPDIRNQLLPLGLKRIDALLLTHTHSDHIAGLDDLRAFCREHLASYKLPSHFVFSVLPKTQTGKIQKTVLREQAKTVT